jgi:hypothetical protein
VVFNVLQHCIQHLQPLGGYYCFKNKNWMSNLTLLMFLVCFFNTFTIVVDILLFLVNILILFLFLIFHHPWCYPNVFLLLTKAIYVIPKSKHFIDLNFDWKCLDLGMFIRLGWNLA